MSLLAKSAGFRKIEQVEPDSGNRHQGHTPAQHAGTHLSHLHICYEPTSANRTCRAQIGQSCTTMDGNADHQDWRHIGRYLESSL